MRILRFVPALFVVAIVSSPSPAAAQPARDFGSVAITARPADADVYIDGERWVSTDTSTALVVQLAPGRHTIEVRAPGRRSFSTVIDVRRGETTPLNVSLPAAADRVDAPPAPAAPNAPIRQVSS